MSFLDWFRKPEVVPFPDDIQDAELGRLRYVEVLLVGAEVDIWQGMRPELNGKRIEISIGGDRDGPDPELREAFIHFQAKYDEFRDLILSALANSSSPPPEDALMEPHSVSVLRSVDSGKPCLEVLFSTNHPADDGRPYAVKLVDWNIVDTYRW